MQSSEKSAGRWIFGRKHLVLRPVHEEAVVLPVVRVKGSSQRNQLDGLTLWAETRWIKTTQTTKTCRKIQRLEQIGSVSTLVWDKKSSRLSLSKAQNEQLYLLQDAAGGSEPKEMFVGELCGNVADLLIRKSLDWIHLTEQRRAETNWTEQF